MVRNCLHFGVTGKNVEENAYQEIETQLPVVQQSNELIPNQIMFAKH
ncbi:MULTISPECIES: hypothetical protein [unclassified Tolypothrix]|nr:MULTISPECIES: hypothetical protein [unclassified Tolypothrix]BAY93849.1 hypothetical protein NIES3275_58930 [Microchaete diplosiphon NIES-3275]EKF03442.1 hypothetical protein FDUTEX481_02568 [Tolypothrix sp. PCC 7601]MBE9082110.1 hypothetical protein [Tolypothrix sp. LEGE 11397]UYD27634.1 hypothetical protein HGR01_06085 [Tolypothrix sp. PCC 7712]UYD36503.1 hypothetical protein HG267_12610 [Tolypothrix sp. PCC 7601]